MYETIWTVFYIYKFNHIFKNKKNNFLVENYFTNHGEFLFEKPCISSKRHVFASR